MRLLRAEPYASDGGTTSRRSPPVFGPGTPCSQLLITAGAEGEREGRRAGRRVELQALLIRFRGVVEPAGVVDRHGVADGGTRAGSHNQVCLAEGRVAGGGRGRLAAAGEQ
jgi:hypothetical protein